jgi:hypothetical protein
LHKSLLMRDKDNVYLEIRVQIADFEL